MPGLDPLPSVEGGVATPRPEGAWGLRGQYQEESPCRLWGSEEFPDIVGKGN